ncbi:Hypothetical predicted protein [Podarcis lilfordi]|uniref:Uncharacterized protein n=1 Tax=Podarcis lilfordi TaxID=74358 RepID=A0AA35KJH6_9SAUR|nr:Hypothetical predicted protein [Podarcis lilfordi]
MGLSWEELSAVHLNTFLSPLRNRAHYVYLDVPEHILEILRGFNLSPLRNRNDDVYLGFWIQLWNVSDVLRVLNSPSADENDFGHLDFDESLQPEKRQVEDDSFDEDSSKEFDPEQLLWAFPSNQIHRFLPVRPLTTVPWLLLTLSRQVEDDSFDKDSSKEFDPEQ